MRLNRQVSLALYLGVSAAIADQLSKWYLVNEVMRPPHTEEVTPFFNLVMVENKGVTFGLLNTIDKHYMSYVLIGFALVVLFLLGRWLWRTSSTPVAAGLGLVMGGAVGNIVDRARFGAVVDFLDFYYRSYHWPAFNVADSAIVVGVGLLLCDSVLRAR